MAGLLLKGAVQVDETYVGADRHGKVRIDNGPKRKRGRGTEKTPVVALVETGGRVRSRPVEHVDIKTLRAAMQECIDPSAAIVTDELNSYPKAAAGFAGGHFTVKHSDGEYVNADGFNTNSAESYFSLLKRGIIGAFHHVSPKHLHRYCAEFDFRWDHRKTGDAERRELAIQQAEGKRLTYRTPTP